MEGNVFMKCSGRYVVYAVLICVCLLLYLPVLNIGFLTDDFLDAQTTFSEASRAFTHMLSSGYRPLMSYSWAIDNWIWGTARQGGWHLTNLIILTAALFSLWCFLKLFVKDRNAVLAGVVLFAICTPAAASVAKTVWRTSLLPVIPILWSMFFLVRYSRRERGSSALVLSSLFLLVSVFLKEIALAIPPAFAVLAWSQAQGGNRVKTGLKAFAAAILPVAAYLVTRYLTVGFAMGYSESSTFGLFMVKNVLLLMGKVWTPWLSSVPARILLPLFGIGLWFLPAERRLKVFLAAFSFLVLLTVGNLPPRVDYAVPVVPVFSLSLALVVQKYFSQRFSAGVILCLAAVFLNSVDEIKVIQAASDSLGRETRRIIAISEDIPGNGPLFLVGVQETLGEYGTFWHGEYMLPMQYMGIDPHRFIAGTDRIWEILLGSGIPGYVVFLDLNGGYRSYPVSLDMYPEHPDTVVLTTEPFMAGLLIGYPTCTAIGPYDELTLVSSTSPDSLYRISSVQHDEGWYFDLASVPVWLAGDSSTVIVTSCNELVFTSFNISRASALEVLAAKRSQN